MEGYNPSSVWRRTGKNPQVLYLDWVFPTKYLPVEDFTPEGLKMSRTRSTELQTRHTISVKYVLECQPLILMIHGLPNAHHVYSCKDMIH